MTQRRRQRGGAIVIIVAQIAVFLALFLFAIIYLGKYAVDIEESQAQADAVAVAATIIAQKEGLAAVANGQHPAMDGFLTGNSGVGAAFAGAMRTERILVDQGDGHFKVRYKVCIEGEVEDDFGMRGNPDQLRRCGMAEVDENQFDEIEERRPKLVLVLDYSGSMSAGFGGGRSRIDALRAAVLGLLDQQLRVEYGLVMFNSGIIRTVGIDADDRQQDIRDAITGRGPGGGTIYGDAIARAAQMLNQTEDTGWYILFVTDGYPNNGAGPSLQAADAARGREVTLFTLNVGGGGAQRQLLIDMAGPPGDPGNQDYYFSAGNDAQLQQTFRQIVANILCSIGPINPPPDNADTLHVFLVDRNGDEAPLERTPNIGANPNALAFAYVADENKIRLTQRVCDQVLDNGAHIVARYNNPVLVAEGL